APGVPARLTGRTRRPKFILRITPRLANRCDNAMETISTPTGGLMAREAFDVVVLGTGAAGLTAAIAASDGGATVGLFEEADEVGGTTAWSGGQVWIPNNPHMPDVGVQDSRDKAITYIMSLSRDMIDRRLVEAYVDAGPEMVALLEAKTPVQFYAVPGMPD